MEKRPTCLHGHERAITQIKYNREGDLIFSSAKNPQPCVWFAANGERLGTFEGHNGAVWCIDIDWDSQRFISGAADNTCRIWDCSTGSELHLLKTSTAIRSCGFSFAGNLIMLTTDKAMGFSSEIMIYDTRDPAQMNGDSKRNVWRTALQTGKISTAVWGPLGETIITGHENGELSMYDAKTGEVIKKVSAHDDLITDIQMYHDQTMFVTSSKDHTAKLFGSYDLDHMKTYKTERPVNSAALSPIRDHVLLGGGQEARDVTTTSQKQGKFDARFFHALYAEEFGRVKGHFGPINSVAFTPDGKGFSSGGEDGMVRMHVFDPEYFNFDIEC